MLGLKLGRKRNDAILQLRSAHNVNPVTCRRRNKKLTFPNFSLKNRYFLNFFLILFIYWGCIDVFRYQKSPLSSPFVPSFAMTTAE